MMQYKKIALKNIANISKDGALHKTIKMPPKDNIKEINMPIISNKDTNKPRQVKRITRIEPKYID